MTTAAEKLRTRVERVGDCLIWQGAKKSGGYGAMQYKGRVYGAHQVALELKLGRPRRPGMLACHHCDVPACVNPDHLYEGTPADNARDRVNRNIRKLPPELPTPPGLPRYLRDLREGAGLDRATLAARLGVKPETIRRHEAGLSVPNHVTARAYCDFYAFSGGTLFTMCCRAREGGAA